MASITLNVSIDASEWINRTEHAARETAQAIRSGVNAAAVQAKREFVKAASHDAAGRGATPARVRKQTTPIKRAGMNGFEASFKVFGKGWNVSPAVIAIKRGNQYKIGGATISTSVDTGGGSASLSNSKFFAIASNGGTVILERTAGGMKVSRSLRSKGLRKIAASLSSGAVKKIYATGPRSMMEQPGAVPRQTWERTADAQLAAQIGARMQTVLNGSAPAGDGGGD